MDPRHGINVSEEQTLDLGSIWQSKGPLDTHTLIGASAHRGESLLSIRWN